ncbi:MAG TPA: hypothetical protein VM344_08910 [Vitreimonas sp.]|nr:hypothetical protein [Vitreimonas sp.]
MLPTGVNVRGTVYTDFRVDTPCESQTGPAELSNIVLTFEDAAGRVVGTARTGGLQVEELPIGPGTETWTHGGCRFFAPYSVTIPVAESYAVEFDPPEPAFRAGGYFSGTEELSRQTASHDDLIRSGYVWSFEVPPSFVVP